MDIQELKQLLKHSVSVLILENGEPAFVVVDYEVYKNLLNGPRGQAAPAEQPSPASAERSEQPVDPRELEVLERLNKEILALKSQIELEEKGQSSSEGSEQSAEE